MKDDYQNQYNQHQIINGRLKHSSLGITSFIIAISAIIIGVVCIFLFILGALALTNTSTDDSQMYNFFDRANLGGMSFMLAMFLVLVSFALSFLGGILGLIAIFQKNRKKIFSVLGLILNILVFLIFLYQFMTGWGIGM